MLNVNHIIMPSGSGKCILQVLQLMSQTTGKFSQTPALARRATVPTVMALSGTMWSRVEDKHADIPH